VADLRFGSFRLDPTQRLLTRPDAVIALRPKTLAVLLLLLRRSGEVVSKQEIFASVWGQTVVSDYVLTTCISELRAALGEHGKQPRHLHTVHRTGYRLVVDGSGAGVARPAAGVTKAPPQVAMVGRERELARLQAALQCSRDGQRQIVFVTGEMGIGKTTLVNHLATAFLESGPRGSHDVLLARGQCVERFGAAEPYMPVLEAIGRLGRGADGPLIVEALRRHAPAWLAEIPGVLSPAQRDELRRETPAQTQEPMLRQIADAVEALSETRLLVLVLEDLHLGDHATLELVATLALRERPMHLLVVGTFRDAEPFPLSPAFARVKQQLLLHRQCEEIALAPLGLEAIEEYLAARLGGASVEPGVAASVHRRTEGNPLFVARLIDHLVEADAVAIDPPSRAIALRDTDLARHVPATLRAMIEQRAEALSDEDRDLLEVASVAGVRFCSAIVAAALGRDLVDVERRCTYLTKWQGLLVARAIDGAPLALGASYEFSHALYQQVLYERTEPTRRRRLHDALGDALRVTWGARASEVAADLASHFERGGQPSRAVDCLDQAAAAAAARGANREAIAALDRALTLLDAGGETGRDQRRLDLLMTRGAALLAVAGYASSDVRDGYQRALDLARELSDPLREMSCLLALSTCQQTRGDLHDGEALATELLRSGERIGLPAPLLRQLQNPLSQVRMYQGAIGESLRLADAAVEAMRLFPIPPTPADSRPALWADPGVMLHCQHGAVSFAAGRFAQARAAVEAALRIARALGHPFNQASACTFAALYEDTTGQWESAIAIAEEAVEIARRYDFPFWHGIARIFGGHATACRGDVARGLSLLRDGIELWRNTGARLAASNHLNLLADVLLLAGDAAGARDALAEAEAHAAATGEQVFLPETYRLQARCLPIETDGHVSRALLQLAIDTARRQGTKLWELRSTLALHRQHPSRASWRQLEQICADFAGEPETRDVAAARAALEMRHAVGDSA
jgi:DNA-binding winged helix-turn-helix (wHTH) protein/tetratricopeptide (TPR) repeat protein/energy-coupling factor transporter ATP-binding protein EcfA2